MERWPTSLDRFGLAARDFFLLFLRWTSGLLRPAPSDVGLCEMPIIASGSLTVRYLHIAVVAAAFLAVDLSAASGQGLLRRLGTRLQSRRATVPQTAPNPASQNPYGIRPGQSVPSPGNYRGYVPGRYPNPASVPGSRSAAGGMQGPDVRYRPANPSQTRGGLPSPSYRSAPNDDDASGATTGSPRVAPRGGSPTLAPPIQRLDDNASDGDRRNGVGEDDNQSLGDSVLGSTQPDSILGSTQADSILGSTQADSGKMQMSDRVLMGRPTLGIDVTERPQGLQVTGFRPNSRAPQIGVRVGDTIRAINGRPADTLDEAVESLRGVRIGQVVAITVVRNATPQSFRVPMISTATPIAEADPTSTRMANGSQDDRMPATQSGPRTSATDAQMASRSQRSFRNSLPAVPADDVSEANDPASKSERGTSASIDLGLRVGRLATGRGVNVQSVTPKSPASIAGLKKDDRLVAIRGRLVNDEQQFAEQAATLTVGQEVNLRVIRGGTVFELPITPVRRDQWAQLAANSTADTAKSAGSALGGIGSMLGGLFGGGGNESSTRETKADPPEPPARKTDPPGEDGGADSPRPQNDAPTTKRAASSDAVTSDDEMAFGDEPLPKP